MIPKNHKNAVTLGAPLLACLQRAAIPDQREVQGRARQHRARRAAHRPSSNAEQEEAKEELEVDYNGDAIEIGFNVTYLIDALANIGQEMVKIELQDGNASALITMPGRPGSSTW